MFNLKSNFRSAWRENLRLKAKIAELEAQAIASSATQKDAERYQYLRNRDVDAGMSVVDIKNWSDEYSFLADIEFYTPEQLDKDIDAAMACGDHK